MGGAQAITIMRSWEWCGWRAFAYDYDIEWIGNAQQYYGKVRPPYGIVVEYIFNNISICFARQWTELPTICFELYHGKAMVALVFIFTSRRGFVEVKET